MKMFQNLVDKIKVDKHLPKKLGVSANKIINSINQRLSLHLSNQNNSSMLKDDKSDNSNHLLQRKKNPNISFNGDLRGLSFDEYQSNSGTNEFSFNESSQPIENTLEVNPQKLDQNFTTTFGMPGQLANIPDMGRQSINQASGQQNFINKNMFLGGTLGNLCALEIEEDSPNKKSKTNKFGNHGHFIQNLTAPVDPSFEAQFGQKQVHHNTSGSYFDEGESGYVSNQRSRQNNRQTLSNSKVRSTINAIFVDECMFRSN
jgi:hypothetical protein